MADLPFGARRRDPSLRSSATTEAAGEGGAAPFIYSVSGLQRRLRAEVERGFGNVLVGGEVSSLTLHGTSGHAYFVLKDAQAQLRCVMWKEQLARLRFRLENGVEVVARGRATVFERSGTLQLTVQSLERHGDGAEEEAFETLMNGHLEDETAEAPLLGLARISLLRGNRDAATSYLAAIRRVSDAAGEIPSAAYLALAAKLESEPG